MKLNIVNCGKCGEVFGHLTGVVELSCPYCRFNDDICSFPDYVYPPEHKNALVTLTFEK